MTPYLWIAIALLIWLAVAGLVGILLGHLIAFGVGNDNRGAATVTARPVRRHTRRSGQPVAQRLRA